MTRNEQAIKEAEFRYREHPNSLFNELAFRAGVTWADLTMIDKAVRWLEENAKNYWRGDYFYTVGLIADFKKAMED